MNTRHHIASWGFALVLFALPGPAALAQTPSDSAFLPEGLPVAPGAAQAGIEATGDTTEVKALYEWAVEHRHSHPDQAQQAAERALVLAQELDDQRGIGNSLWILGSLDFISDPEQAEVYYTAAWETFEQIGDERGMVYNRMNLGNVYRSQGKLEKALTAYFSALEGFERLGDTRGQASVLENIGTVHSNQGNLKEELAYRERALALALTLDDPILLAGILNNVGLILAEQESYAEAESHFRRALAIFEREGARQQTAATSNNLGFVLNEQAHHEGALPFLFAAEHLGRELDYDDILIAANDEIGKAYLGLAEYERALHYTNESLVLAQETGSLPRQMEAHQTLSRIYEAAGNGGQALAHYRQYAAARDSAFTTEKAEIVTEMQTRYETEEKQHAIERLEYESQVRLILFVAGVGGLLLLLGFLYNRYRLNQKANRLLEELDAAKSRFFANISHEFRTPLTVILGSVQDALAGRFGKMTETYTEQLHAIHRNSRQLQRLIDEVLALNRLEAGKLDLNPALGDLVRSVKRIVEADAPLAERNGITLTFEHDAEHCPRLYDQEKLEKIVGNLLSNALKFTPKGGSVRVELRSNSPVEIAVSDTGAGIPEDQQEKVFERFAQTGDGSHHGGTGIGLTLAKELAELHNGTITLESEPGKGSTFTVRLPLEKVSDDVGTWRAMSPQQNREFAPPEDFEIGSNGAAPSGQPDTEETDRTTVLIIEDNPDVLTYVRRTLEDTYRVLEAANGETGLQQARAELPDLIVSDVMLPGIDGYEVARRLKTEAGTECIPVVMLTARAAEEDQTEGYGSGAEVYITKPFAQETLRAAIARVLKERLRLRRRLQESTEQERGETSGNGHETLADRARAVVLENLPDEDFGVEELASALGISHRSLYRHLKPEVGLSPGDFVWNIRLERAKQLLSNGAGSVSEVAYAVGFKSLSHFTRTFRERYGTLPSSVLEAQES